MPLNLRTKLVVSHAALIVLTLAIFALVTDTLVINHFRDFYEGLGGMKNGMNPMPPPRENFENTVRTSGLITLGVAGILAILVSIALAQYITEPIKKVIEATRSIAQGDTKKRIPQAMEDDELGALIQAVNEMASSLEHQEQRQKDLIANVSHELATPLTNIAGYIEALKDNVIQAPHKRTQAFTLVQEETDRLKAMLNELRDLTLVQSPGFRIHPERVDLIELTRKTLRSMEANFLAKHLRLTFKSTLKETMFSLDPKRYTQILTNLLSNAQKFTPKNGRIKVFLEELQGGGFKLRVKDSGIGIEAKDLPHLFERFYRTDKARTRENGGTGLGLTITKELVEAHGGTIRVQSQPNHGTTLECRFPVHQK